MGLFNRKPIDYKININENYLLDRPKVDGKLLDVTKSVWFKRGYGVTSWRSEGIDSYHVKIGNLANEDGLLVIEPIRTSEILGFPILSESSRRRGFKSWLESSLQIMIAEGKIRLVSPYPTSLTFYQLTLTPERQPAPSPDLVTIHPLEYPPTKHCVCSDLGHDEMFLGCEICRRIVFAIIQSYYSDFWLEFESAVIQREKPEDPAIFDQGKVPPEIREQVKTSIAHALCLCARSWKRPDDAFDRAQRLDWVKQRAYVPIHMHPKHYPFHRVQIPEPSNGFTLNG
jgi:hypothetical protein